MSLRLATRRLFCSKPVPLGLSRPSSSSITESFKGFSFGKFFEETYFWKKANVGPFFILLFCTPMIYRSVKDMYWTRQLRKLSTEEIISDRYEWLRLNMLQDEVEAAFLASAPAGGVASLELGPSTPP
mmetsp:Transcript_48839/g.97155  ORF Transcript_48839/g.97155 Transcript_48839/m.97155 type:complete len:128 (-) Transcript_48839:102-485(-)|eukprot:CAMPEP_0172721228 /NCGR_PEP_ID=MMETSP1074-20121228/78611_1 /TAXON_ID=2916 /ORGANISM="Ceratium fusus, Strain PA161109" /LENGTH=127 /DNA_ID=CAMNT_0013546919 /DNA_START=68 /DNA_END=451 /DNA_ORIENTATION=+